MRDDRNSRGRTQPTLPPIHVHVGEAGEVALRDVDMSASTARKRAREYSSESESDSDDEPLTIIDYSPALEDQGISYANSVTDFDKIYYKETIDMADRAIGPFIKRARKMVGAVKKRSGKKRAKVAEDSNKENSNNAVLNRDINQGGVMTLISRVELAQTSYTVAEAFNIINQHCANVRIRPLYPLRGVMDRIVRPAIYLLTLALRPDGRPLIILTPPQLMLVRNSIATIIHVLDFVQRKARVTDDIGALSFAPALPELLDLQMLLFAYYGNKEPPPLLGNILSHSLLLARSGQLVEPLPRIFDSFIDIESNEVWHNPILVSISIRGGHNPAKDISKVGEAKLESSTLATFNKKIIAMIEGHGFEKEEDECLAMAFENSELPEDKL
ncbi:hypothetical protein B0H13DRAFT_1861690 [Mycena leptocephala]|nr:hypothetical protein B0H13DRAFT_1861690 [Mycena leptocephala]